MDKKFLKEKKLLEAHKQFKHLCEWSYVPRNLEEDDDDDQNSIQQPNQNASQIQTQPNDVQGANAENGLSNDGVQGMPQNDVQNVPQDDTQGIPQDDMQMDAQQIGDNNNDNMPMEVPEDEGEDEDVIDVDDITDAQEKMNTKVNHVGKELGSVDDKIEALLSSLDNMEKMIDNNNREIEKFKQEFEKRNPTQTEKLNLRSLDSYPFNVSPKDYWDEKGMNPNSNYSGYSDNDEKTTDEYQITNNDVDDFNENEIEDSFDIDDDMNQDINKIFGLK